MSTARRPTAAGEPQSRGPHWRPRAPGNWRRRVPDDALHLWASALQTVRRILVRAPIVTGLATAIGCGGTSTADSAATDPPEGAPSPTTAAVPSPALTRAEVVAARRKFEVEVLEFDASQRYGAEFPYADRMRLRITNASDVTLPCLTVQTRRYVGSEMVGASRAPTIPAKDLGPGQSVEYDYFPKGHLDGAPVSRMTAVIEGMVDPEEEQFICELQGVQ